MGARDQLQHRPRKRDIETVTDRQRQTKIESRGNVLSEIRGYSTDYNFRPYNM